MNDARSRGCGCSARSQHSLPTTYVAFGNSSAAACLPPTPRAGRRHDRNADATARPRRCPRARNRRAAANRAARAAIRRRRSARAASARRTRRCRSRTARCLPSRSSTSRRAARERNAVLARPARSTSPTSRAARCRTSRRRRVVANCRGSTRVSWMRDGWNGDECAKLKVSSGECRVQPVALGIARAVGLRRDTAIRFPPAVSRYLTCRSDARADRTPRAARRSSGPS